MHRELDMNPIAPFPGSAGQRCGFGGWSILSRGGRGFHVRGVAYGPFAPNSDGQPFPEVDVVARDFTQMKAIGINACRVYHVPPPKLLDLAHQHELGIMTDVPWSKHSLFSAQFARLPCRPRRVRAAAEQCRARRPCWLAASATKFPRTLSAGTGPGGSSVFCGNWPTLSSRPTRTAW